jgi:hypothetical protein
LTQPSASDPDIGEGWVAGPVAEEHPGLRLCWIVCPGGEGRSPREIKARLRILSGRFGGAQAVTMRSAPVPHAYRVFFRQVGLDPDTTRTPVEEAAMRRLIEGGFTSHGILHDAMLMALVETGVPLWALDEDACQGPLGIREARPRETLGDGPYADELPGGRLVVADDRGAAAVLFGEIAPDRRPGRGTRCVRVFAVQVAGVPELHVQEALWGCAEALGAG